MAWEYVFCDVFSDYLRRRDVVRRKCSRKFATAVVGHKISVADPEL
ncbi:hypothetical protein CCACVL1_19868 [Corchorus capsularis]|uniref:Uncharacterized protein n=1 Tax=Corchorus capsularis TaxID=210143 RepID=A0A1R3HEB4_COCAP|nr:hypothetical protein CCACVL1_19868 [Corchorus capsularis]